MRQKPKLQEKWGALLTVGLVSLLVTLLIILSLYLIVFNDGLSVSAYKWSAFGSYFGGVLGPVVSLVTLFAVMRTIGLQLEQSEHFVRDGAQQRVEAYKTCQLKLLDQQINMNERMIDRYNQEGLRLLELSKATNVSQREHLLVLDRAIQECESRVGKLLKLSLVVSVYEFGSTQEVRAKMESELTAIDDSFNAVRSFET
ncbi:MULTISPECIES: hypothetical protein [Pseudomonas]|uniref:Uncharacterized protein n=1 Tax=Pseudomonas putida NBRC 14164 TaxID=1211579 RepID=A0ABN5UJH1_PSEPU|nr:MULTISPECIES: hypothetical protein [Pseudomonas]EKT4460386.1 hypothetical protein [Pseudomonas putida]EKT4553932.1 hypothetical protein [Pseudomonas putida]MCX9135308.1 hypothetical protein [Pseudomonas sp. DCB_PUT]MDD1970493.1 hypothetical protein [Pseudomonas putida]MDO1462804.1 hypothetical protein [Pseudomonas putida]